MKVTIKTLSEMIEDPDLNVYNNEIYSRNYDPDCSFFVDSMGHLLGKTIEVEDDDGLYFSDEGYSIYPWMIK